jgi:hypothetical protein
MLAVASSFNDFDGSFELSIPGVDFHAAISENGQRMYFSLNMSYNQTLVYENTGT